MKELKDVLVGIHYSRHFGGPGRITIDENGITVTPRKKKPFVYRGDVVVTKKKGELPFANHWLEVKDGNETVHLTCSKKRAHDITEALQARDVTVFWE